MSRPALKSWSSMQAVAILAVDNIRVSEFGHDVLKRKEDGLVTFEEPKKEILTRARAKASQKAKYSVR